MKKTVLALMAALLCGQTTQEKSYKTGITPYGGSIVKFYQVLIQNPEPNAKMYLEFFPTNRMKGVVTFLIFDQKDVAVALCNVPKQRCWAVDAARKGGGK